MVYYWDLWIPGLGKKYLRIDKHFDYFKPKFIGVLWWLKWHAARGWKNRWNPKKLW
jgi:hypothetical protein